MALIFVDKEGEEGQSSMRQQMRRNMRGGYRYDGDMMTRSGSGSGNFRDGYRMGYRHGWEDSEDEMEDEHYRRQRDSRGRYI